MNAFLSVLEIFWGTYAAALMMVYTLLFVFSSIAIYRFMVMNRFVDDNAVFQSQVLPGISIVAPAYNESVSIIDNVRSLLTLYYSRYEVIIVDDGSTDDTLQKLIHEFHLVEIPDYIISYKVPCEPILAVYRSQSVAHKRLTVVHKVNGKSKADATNAGLNVAAFPYILNTDVDCVLANKTLVHLIEPILNTEKRVIAVGATLRMSNSSYVDAGTLIEANLPTNMLVRFQEMEYIRSYLLGKMGWTLINSVPNVSGGLGLFDKEILIAAGGYDRHSLGEDMEMVQRMCRWMCDHHQEYLIKYIPKTLCWTEGPDNLTTFMRQRVRWSRGLFQIIKTHFSVFLNPHYKKLGLIVFPYNFIFEFLAPILEVLGIIFYIYLIASNAINWNMAILLLALVYTFSVLMTSFSILLDHTVSRYYTKKSDVIKLCLAAFLEPFIYHPIITYCSIKGYIQELFKKKHAWGTMARKGALKVQTLEK